MPFRARIKRAFGRSGSGSSSPSGGSTTPSGLPIEYYKEHEVPRSKYRGPWNQAHQDKLSSFAFSFGRKKSFQGSEWSPAQTRAHSRRSSWISHKRPSTRSSISESSVKVVSRAPSRVGQVPEVDGDDDVANVGMSRRVTREKRGPNFGRDPVEDSEEENELAHQETVTLPQLQSEHDVPFTEEELAKALTAATLKPSKSSGMA